MELLNEVWSKFYAFWEVRYWWRGFGMLIVWFFLLWIAVAFPLAQVFARSLRKAATVESSAYLAWFLTLLIHLGLWLPYGPDNARLAWYGGVLGVAGARSPATNFEYAVAALTVLPYLLLPLVEIVLLVLLWRRFQAYAKSGG